MSLERVDSSGKSEPQFKYYELILVAYVVILLLSLIHI